MVNMGDYTVTIDSGTTNTRVMLWDEDKHLTAVRKIETGARLSAIEGNNDRLRQGVRDSILGVLQDGGMGWREVGQVIASGMITSNAGLVEIPHICTPAGGEELAAHGVEVLLEDVCPLPVLFIPGICSRDSRIDLDNFDEMDMMRGEEVESIALIRHFPENREYLLVLPGSHTKFVAVNRQGQITGCLTTISGELVSAITHHTIISGAVGRALVNPDGYDREMCLKGYETSARTGLGRACFSARILDTFLTQDRQKLASYLLGAVLQSDLAAVKGSRMLGEYKGRTVIVSGRNPVRQALVDLFRRDGYFTDIREFQPPDEFPLSAEGAFVISGLRKSS